MARFPIVIIKYSFFAVMVFSAGLVIERLTGIKRSWKTDPVIADDLIHNSSSPMLSGNFDKILSKRYLRCLTEPSKPFCLLSANKRLEVFQSDMESPSVEEIKSRLHNVTSDFPSRKRKIHSLLVKFTRFMQTNQVKTILMEPSMLFCLLSSTTKFSMLAKGFNPGRLLGSRNVVTVGILDEDSKKLEMGNLTNEMLSAGFKIIKFRKWIGEESLKEFVTAHYFFILQDVAVHGVMFYARNGYLWHTSLDPKEIDFEGLLFVNESIYENFTILPLNLAGTSISRMFFPHDVRYFMREIEFSKLVECRTNSTDAIANTKHPTLTKEQLRTRVGIVLKELKTILVPNAAFFWLWSKSLLGWFAECDIFYYSSTLDLALMFRSIQGLNISELLTDNDFLTLRNISESNSKYGYKLDCHGLLVNLQIIHEDNGPVWYKYDDNHEEYALKYPMFTLCSSEVFGQKIQIPCNITNVLEVEFPNNRTWNHLSMFS